MSFWNKLFECIPDEIIVEEYDAEPEPKYGAVMLTKTHKWVFDSSAHDGLTGAEAVAHLSSALNRPLSASGTEYTYPEFVQIDDIVIKRKDIIYIAWTNI